MTYKAPAPLSVCTNTAAAASAARQTVSYTQFCRIRAALGWRAQGAGCLAQPALVGRDGYCFVQDDLTRLPPHVSVGCSLSHSHPGPLCATDYGRDGYTVGSPPFAGDYFMPGVRGPGAWWARNGLACADENEVKCRVFFSVLCGRQQPIEGWSTEFYYKSSLTAYTLKR